VGTAGRHLEDVFGGVLPLRGQLLRGDIDVGQHVGVVVGFVFSHFSRLIGSALALR
jgi:hypothetical protein